MIILVPPSVGFCQETIDGTKSLFHRSDVELKGRLRHLVLEELAPGTGVSRKKIVTVERQGKYPDWSVRLSTWSIHPEPTRESDVTLPADAVFFGFAPLEGPDSKVLVLIRQRQLEVWTPEGATFVKAPPLSVPIDTSFSVAELGEVTPIQLLSPLNDGKGITRLLIPTPKGIREYLLDKTHLRAGDLYGVMPRMFYHSEIERQPFDLPFWVRNSVWYPAAILGNLTTSTRELLWPWMDEVDVVPLDQKSAVRTLRFNQMTEAERDDAQSYVVTVPEDLDGDGRTDFLVNKFQGAATALRAQTTLFFTDSNGNAPEKGLVLKPPGNRAAGALSIDINKDNRKDLAVASSQFNAWAIVRALIQHRVNVTFSLYLARPDGYKLDHPDFEREISFRFNLEDAEIEGLLPTLEGDFNGDGYVDALYARDRRQLSILIQKPNSKDLLPSSPSGTYDIAVPRQFRIGDLNGDGKSDIVLFDRRSSGNQRFTVLVNNGRL
ncbi:MAG TPA: VCBS repeat-containing protein [Bdellovibrionota bacterium]|nr:VCBS repeat-containing protein [Bdellovibrionota bacterium]